MPSLGEYLVGTVAFGGEYVSALDFDSSEGAGSAEASIVAWRAISGTAEGEAAAEGSIVAWRPLSGEMNGVGTFEIGTLASVAVIPFEELNGVGTVDPALFFAMTENNAGRVRLTSQDIGSPGSISIAPDASGGGISITTKAGEAAPQITIGV